MRGLRTAAVLGSCALALAAAGPVEVSTSSSPVADATRTGDREMVRSLLKEGRDVNAAQGDGMTALHWAALANDVAMAEMLLYAGANVEATTRLGAYTPLLLASKNGRDAMVETLLGAGADANTTTTTTTTGATALMLAAASGNDNAVRLLLDHGANVNAVESTGGQTALMFAAAYGRDAVIETLIEEGADADATTRVVNVPELNQAIDDNFRKRLEQVREQRAAKAEAEGVAQGGETPATRTGAGQNEEEEEAEQAEPESGKGFFAKLFGWITPDEKKEAPQERPRRRRESFGARVGLQGGMTALLLAARQGHVESVKKLLDGGADINQLAEGSKTSPILIATMNGHFDLAKYLLDRGADPTLAAEPSNITPLYAVINLAWAPRAAYPQPTFHKQQELTHLELKEALLQKGADPNVRLTKKVWFMGYNSDRSGVDENGATPFWRAAYGSDVAAMRLLRSYGADVNKPTRKPRGRPRVGNQEGREIKDVSGLPPVPVGGPAITPLHAAAGAGYGEGFAANDHRNHPAGFLPAVQYLVEECGADVNARDHEGGAPLHNAAARGDVEMILYLVSKGADVTLLNREGQSTADMANGPVQRVQPFPEARDLLVRLGAVNHDKCVSC